jgi:hypothetical protein
MVEESTRIAPQQIDQLRPIVRRVIRSTTPATTTEAACGTRSTIVGPRWSPAYGSEEAASTFASREHDLVEARPKRG